MHSRAIPFKVKILLSILFILKTTEYTKNNFTQGAIMIYKRGNFRFYENVNNYCILPRKEEDYTDSIIPSSLKIDCSQVPGPVLKLDIGADSYFRLNTGHYVAPTEYCALKGNSKYGKLCPMHSNTLWRKCCAENEILDTSTFKCRQSRVKYRPKVANSVFQSFVTIAKTNSTLAKERIFDVQLQCENGYVTKLYSSNPCVPGSSGNFQLATNGTPMFEMSTGVFLRKTQLRSVEHAAYCLDGTLDFSSSSCATLDPKDNHDNDDNFEDTCRRMKVGEVLLVCMEKLETFLNDDHNNDIPKAYFFAALWLGTCPFLLCSAIVNSFVIQKNVHGWILTSYLISMFLVNINSVLILGIRVPTSAVSPNSEGGCGVLDFTMKFIYLSSLCWMSSMCMNMLRTFSSSVPQVSVEPHRFLLSALFSLGFPGIVVSVSYYVGSLPDDASFLQKFRQQLDINGTIDSVTPQLKTCQRGTCALYSYKTLPYYSGPIILLVLCNVAAFLKTSTTIASLRKQAEAVLHKQTRDNLESFALFAKLFLLTGSIWVIRVVLLVLQIQGLYVTWYGVALEAVFSIPEVVFPMIIFHHPEFIKWASRKSPTISRIIFKCSPFCKTDLMFKDRANSHDSQSANQLSSVTHQQQNLSSNSTKSIQGHFSNQAIIMSDMAVAAYPTTTEIPSMSTTLVSRISSTTV